MAELSLSEIAKIAAEIGAQTAIEKMDQERKRQQKVKHDWRLRNTKLLLRNYRSFLLHSESIKLHVEKLDAEALEELDSDKFAIESIKRSKQKTLVMINFVQQMMWVYQIMCEKSGINEDVRRYRTVEMMYIAEDKLSAKEIAERHSVDIRTVYKDIDRACETLSTLMFGVDGARLVD